MLLQVKHHNILKKKYRTLKNMDKYTQPKRFHNDHLLQVYMYYFMYVDSDKCQWRKKFPATKSFVENYKKMSVPVPAPKHWIGFSYINS